MSETSPAQMPTVSQSRLKDTPIAVGSDSDSKTTTDTPFGVIISNDGVCAAIHMKADLLNIGMHVIQ